jgi:hypothetical protein
MSEDEISCPGACNEPVNSSGAVPSNMTVSRGPLEADTFGARAPIPPRVVLPCFDPSHYSKRVRIANVVWRVEGAFISYKALIYPWCPFFRSMPVCHHFSGSKKSALQRKIQGKTRSLRKPDETLFYYYTADIPPHVRTLRSGEEI